MKKTIIMAFVFAFSACIGQIAAQNRMSVRDCMEYALQNSAKIIEQTAATSDAKADRREALLSIITPQVSGNASAYTSFGRAIDPETNTYSNSTYFNNSYSISGGYTLFDGFAAVNNYRIARIAARMGVEREQQISNEICLSTIEAYYNAVYYSRMASILERQVDAARRALELAERQQSLGIKSSADVIQMQADLAEKEYNLTIQRNKFDDALLTLKQVMMYPVEEELEIIASLSYEVNPVESIRSIEQITDNALATLPDVAISQSDLKNAQWRLQSARLRLLPSLNLQGGWSTSYYTYPSNKNYDAASFNQQFHNNGGEYVQVSMSIPIFNRLSRQGNIKRMRNAVRVAEAKNRKKIGDVEAEVMRAVQDRNGCATAYVGAEKRVSAQQAAYEVNLKKYEQGLVSALDLQTVSNQLLSAEAERLNMMLQYALKSKIVNYYDGVPFIEQE